MAHEFAMKLIGNPSTPLKDTDSIVRAAWYYADAMQAEADERKVTGLPDVLKVSNSIGLKKMETFGDLNSTPSMQLLIDADPLLWQPDWSQAPSDAQWWTMDKSGLCDWHKNEPAISGDVWDHGCALYRAPSFGYQGNWQDSLRKRP